MEMIYALPIFGLLLLLEFLYGYFKKNNTYHDVKDTAASLSLGLAQVSVTVVVSAALLAIDQWFYMHRIFTFGNAWYDFVLLILLMEFSFYWWHRASHRVRFLWANHVNHHSSTEYNFSTALRQPLFSPVLRPLFYFYLPWLGFSPQMIIGVGVVSLIWGVLSHTKHIGKLGFLEYILVTPSAHRVHHGSNSEYIDKNYGGIFIFWDMLFGTYAPEKQPVVFGITTNITSYNPIRITFHEWQAWCRDVWHSRSLSEAFRTTFRPPN
jgi:sterol desaturase/sphingolipid hydroxylase (fatty acid hydroxylase superfamily)